MQVFANGFFVGAHSYLRSNWNVMDGSLVVLSLFDVAVSLSAAQGQRNSLGILRVFRLLRTLRPLRSVPAELASHQLSRENWPFRTSNNNFVQFGCSNKNADYF